MEQKKIEDVIYSNTALEELSFHNMVYFYRDELRALDGGHPALSVFPSEGVRIKLTRIGVLDCRYKAQGREIVITEKTRRILSEESC